MENDLRKKLQAVKKELDKIREELGVCLGQTQDIMDAETDIYDDLPENLKESDRGQKLKASEDALQKTIDGLNEIDDKLSDIDSYIDTAMK